MTSTSKPGDAPWRERIVAGAEEIVRARLDSLIQDKAQEPSRTWVRLLRPTRGSTGS